MSMSHAGTASTRILSLIFVCLLTGHSWSAGEVREQRGFAPNQVYQIGDIDSVNVSNGDVIIRIPIGQQYTVGPLLKYQLLLTYNSKVWDYSYGRVQTNDPDAEQRVAYPEKHSNAGFGWILSLGSLEIERDNANPPKEVLWTYVAPDGAEFGFRMPADANANPNQMVLYAFNGRYLRLRRLYTSYETAFEIDFPDGQTHRFDGDGRLREMRDLLGNWVRIDPATTYQDPRWKIYDGYGNVQGRTHYVTYQTFDSSSYLRANFLHRITAVDLETFGGARAPYALTYTENVAVGYGGGAGTGTPQPCFKAPLLSTVELPDKTTYRATYNPVDESRCTDNDLNGSEGAINSLVLPTGGSVEWKYGSYASNLASCTRPYSFATYFSGVTARTFKDENGAEVSKWIYTSRFTDVNFQFTGHVCEEDTAEGLIIGPAEEVVTTVESPDGMVTKHYFSAWPEHAPQGSLSDHGFDGDQMGLPIAPDKTSGGRALSTEVYDCSASCPKVSGFVILPEHPVRRTYLSYAREPLFHNGMPWTDPYSKFPWVVEGERTEFLDGNGVTKNYIDTAYLMSDGYGHFGRTVTTDDFTSTRESPTLRVRTSTTQWLRNTNAWLLDMFSTTTVEEGGVQSKSKADFDLTTGLRKSNRVLADGSTEQGKDLLTVWCRDSSVAGSRGFITSERTYGGDLAPIPAGDLCAATPAAGHYVLNHSYKFGQEPDGSPTPTANLTGHSAQWLGTNFLATNETFDGSTGLVSASRDSSGLETTYSYDVFGRITEIHPFKQAWTRYRYNPVATTESHASVHADVWPYGGNAADGSSAGALRDDHYYYDGLGRLLLSKTRMPGQNRWAAGKLVYDSSGRVIESSVPVETQSADYEPISSALATRTSYDIFGRPLQVLAPDYKNGDGGKVEYAYEGVRATTRTQYVWNGTNNVAASTREEYDGAGHLVTVTEPSGEGGAPIATKYTYDIDGHLTSVRINGDVQPRLFEYDRRGFLTSDHQPESGTTSYTYDARGLVATKTAAMPAYDLRMSYDSAGRQILVQERDPGTSAFRNLKTFEYGTDNGDDDWRKGKLWKATRFNWPPSAPALSTRLDPITVTETYTYRRNEENRTERKTEIVSDDTTLLATFTQSEHYDELNEPDVVNYPKCDGCGLPPRDSVTSHYSYGQVDRVDGAIPSITYGPTGWLERKHENGIVDVQTADPHGMARPAAIGVVIPPPCNLISTQPEDRSITPSASVTLTVASNTSGAAFQWYSGPRGDTRNKISGATSPELFVPAVTATTAFWCRVSTAVCSEDSRAAIVDVCDLIAQEPESKAVDQGSQVTLQVTSTQPDAAFQWYKGLSGDTSQKIDGATSAILQLQNVTTTQSYWCRVSWNSCVRNSRTAVIRACTPYAIIRPAEDVTEMSTVTKGVALTFSAEATGELLTYRWYSERGSGNSLVTEELGTGPSIIYAPTTVTTAADPLVIKVAVTNGCSITPRKVALLVVVAKDQLPPCRVEMLLTPPETDYTLMDNQNKVLKAKMHVRPLLSQDIADGSHPLTDYGDIKYRFRWFQDGISVQDYTSVGEKPAGAPAQFQETASNNYIVAPFTKQTSIRLDATVICSNGTQTVVSDVESHRSFIYDYGHCPVPAVVSVPNHGVIRGTTPLTLTADSIYPGATFKWFKGESGNTALEAWQGEQQTLTVTEPGLYWVRASSGCGSADSPTVQVSKATGDTGKETVCSPVRIRRDPQEQSIAASAPVTLSVDATADPMATSFVWAKSVSENLELTGPSITLNPGPNKTTDYFVRVGNSCSLEQSRSARVHVVSCVDMTDVVQPTDPSVAENDVVSLVFNATTVAPLRYQWYLGNSGDTSKPIGGVNPGDAGYDPAMHGPTLNLGPVKSTQRYWARLFFDDATKCQIDSRTATVTVCAAPHITNVPGDRTSVIPSLDQSFEVGVAGEGYTYAWYQGANVTDETQPLLSTRPSLLVYPPVTTSYWVKVTSDCATPYQDRVARFPFTVSVCPAFRDGGMPTAAKTLVPAGTTTTLGIAVDRGDLIEWFKIVGTGDPVKFDQGANVTTQPITQDTTFFARATSGTCTQESNHIVVRVCSSPTVRWGINSTQIAKNASAALTVALNAGETASFKWYRGNTSGDVANSTLVSQSSASYQTGPLQTTTGYWVRATDETTGCYSDTPVLMVNVCVPTIITSPQSIMINPGASTTLRVVTDDLPGVSYQWYKGQSSDISNRVEGATADTLTVTSQTAGMYWVRVSGCTGPAAVTRDSAAATVSVCQAPTITAEPQPKVMPRNYGGSLSVTATGDGLHYQWYEGTAGDVTKPVGTDSNVYAFTSSVSKRFWVRVSGSCGSKDSAAALVSVEPEITNPPESRAVTKGWSTTLTVASNGTDLTYSWYQRTGATTAVVPGQTAASFTTPPVNVDTTYYSRVCSGAGLACTNSSDAVLTVCQPNAFTVTAFGDVSESEVRLSVDAPVAGETYQWYQLAADNTSTLVGSGATFYVYPPATTSYWLRTSRATCQADSAARTVTVCRPKIKTQPASSNALYGDSMNLTVMATGTGTLFYQWYKGPLGDTSTPSGNTATISTGALTATTSYWVRVTSSSTCSTRWMDSTVATITVCRPPAITAGPAAGQFAKGAHSTISVTAVGDSLHYQWYEGASGNTTKPVGFDQPTFDFYANATTSYWVRVTGVCGTAKDSAAAQQSVFPQITQQPAYGGCGTTTTFSVRATGADTYTWYRQISTNPWEVAGTGVDLPVTFSTLPVKYRAEVKSGDAVTTSNTVTVNSVNTVPSLTDFTSAYNTSYGNYTLTAAVPTSERPSLAFRFYKGALGDTSTLIKDWTFNYVTVSVPVKPAKYWVNVYYPNSSNPCTAQRELTVQ